MSFSRSHGSLYLCNTEWTNVAKSWKWFPKHRKELWTNGEACKLFLQLHGIESHALNTVAALLSVIFFTVTTKYMDIGTAVCLFASIGWKIPKFAVTTDRMWSTRSRRSNTGQWFRSPDQSPESRCQRGYDGGFCCGRTGQSAVSLTPLPSSWALRSRNLFEVLLILMHAADWVVSRHYSVLTMLVGESGLMCWWQV